MISETVLRTPVQRMDDRQREWFATAMIAMVLADGDIFEEEMESLMATLSFVEDPAVLGRLKKYISHKIVPQLQVFTGWQANPRWRAAMLIDLMRVAIADKELSGQESEQLHRIGRLLGFANNKIELLLNTGQQALAQFDQHASA